MSGDRSERVHRHVDDAAHHLASAVQSLATILMDTDFDDQGYTWRSFLRQEDADALIEDLPQLIRTRDRLLAAAESQRRQKD